MITLDLGALLPALAPLLGAVVVLVLDVVDPRAQRVHYPVAGISLVVGMSGTFGSLAPSGDDRAPCACPAAAPCFYSVTGRRRGSS